MIGSPFMALVLFLGFPLQAQTPPRETCLFFISDCQQPMKIEELFLKPYRNEEARDSLFSDILKKKPSDIFLLGDLTWSGFSDDSWRPIDTFLARLTDIHASVNAIAGNHEYIGNAKKGIAHFKKRFPENPLLGYCVGKDSLAVIMLNSNFNELSMWDIQQQNRWYAKALDSLEADASVKAIIVCTHHAAYTNSARVKPSRPVLRHFVPRFMESSKAKLFISGHSHNLELFKPKPGKYFLVIGGGGGLTQPLLLGEKKRSVDLIEQGKKPLYFYITVRQNGIELLVESHGIRNDFGSFITLPVVTIQLSNPPPGMPRRQRR
jgi:predicted MPP superfamily phosphohydrolase